jgi:hypothetical protein
MAAPGACGLPEGLPSNLTKESYAKYLLSAKSFAIIFANGERL